MLPPRFSCDADTGSQGPRSSTQSGRPCGLPWHLPRADLQPSFLKGSGVFLPGPWEQGAPACLNHRNKPITASWGPGAAPHFLPQSCPLRRMQRASDLRGLERPLPGAPTSSSWVPSPEPPPHLPGSPPRSILLLSRGPHPGTSSSSPGVPSRSPCLVSRVGRSVPMVGLPLLITEWRRCSQQGQGESALGAWDGQTHDCI